MCTARKLSPEEQAQLARLGCMRIWSLKQHCHQPLMTRRFEESSGVQLAEMRLADDTRRLRWLAASRLEYYEVPPRPS